jgi:hypothetical protein
LKGKIEKAKKVEKKMTKYKNKEKNYQKIIVPTLFYCTFAEKVAQ